MMTIRESDLKHAIDALVDGGHDLSITMKNGMIIDVWGGDLIVHITSDGMESGITLGSLIGVTIDHGYLVYHMVGVGDEMDCNTIAHYGFRMWINDIALMAYCDARIV